MDLDADRRKWSECMQHRPKCGMETSAGSWTVAMNSGSSYAPIRACPRWWWCQLIGLEDCLWNDLCCVEWEVKCSLSLYCWTLLISVWISQPWSSPFCSVGWPGSTTLQNIEIQPKMFHCFRTNLVELTPFDNPWPITATDSVLCAFENCYSAQHTRHYFSTSMTA